MLDGTTIEAAQNEFVVKTYHASKVQSRITNTFSDGLLHVTNKRVIFRMVSTTSVIHSEIPIDNVSGISLYQSKNYDWRKILLYVFLSIFIIIPTIAGIFGGVFDFILEIARINYWLTIGMSCLLIGLLVRSNEQVNKYFSTSPTINLNFFVTLMVYVLLLLFLYSLVQQTSNTIVSLVYIFLICIVSAFLISILISRLSLPQNIIPYKHNMSLSVVSKGGSSTPIMVAGSMAVETGMALHAVAQALDAQPGPDAEALIKELGALIHDIQTLGDYGIERWKHTTPSVTA